jgi:hypothetical protein
MTHWSNTTGQIPVLLHQHTPLGLTAMRSYRQYRKALLDLHDSQQYQYLISPSLDVGTELGRTVIAVSYSEASIATHQLMDKNLPYHWFNLQDSTTMFGCPSECMLALLTSKCTEDIDIKLDVLMKAANISRNQIFNQTAVHLPEIFDNMVTKEILETGMNDMVYTE